MTFLESYLGNKKHWQKLKAEGTHIEFVTQTAHSALAPPRDLLDDWNATNKTLQDWQDINYRERYYSHIEGSEKAQLRLEELREIESSGTDVCVVCYEKDFPCHRFYVLEMFVGGRNEG